MGIIRRAQESRRGREGHILPDNGGRVGRLEVGTFSLDGVRSWRFLKDKIQKKKD